MAAYAVKITDAVPETDQAAALEAERDAIYVGTFPTVGEVKAWEERNRQPYSCYTTVRLQEVDG
jgi:hypothetical protein